MSDVPQRRRANQAPESKSDPLGTLKKYRVPIVIVIIWAAVVGYNVAVAQGVIESGAEECPGHWHTGYSVWIEDQQIGFNPSGPGGDSSASPATGFHIHGNDGTLHFHPAAKRCIPVGEAFDKLGVTASNDELVLDAQHAMAGSYTENGTHQVVVYHKEWDGSWKEVNNVASFMGQQTGNGDQVMIAYMANDSSVTVEDRQAQTTDLTGGNYEPADEGVDDGTFIGITMATIFAIFAIVIWFNLVKKTW